MPAIHAELTVAIMLTDVQRIYSTLITRGRSTLSQLRQYTALTERQLRHGLAVLIQQNLLYFHTDSDTRTTTYEANPGPAYNLVRTGKILEMIETSYGAAVKDVMQSLFILGQTRIEDLKAAYEDRIRQQDEATKGRGDEVMFEGDEATPAAPKPTLPVPSIKKLNNILCRLVETGLVEVVHVQTFVSPEDIFSDVSDRVTRNKFPGGVKGAKGKLEFDEAVAMELRKIRRESTTLKRKLEESGSAAKRRKLVNGDGVNGDHEQEGDPVLDVGSLSRCFVRTCMTNSCISRGR
jgi:DNA-directed RNA polymerase III subunit RPC3